MPATIRVTSCTAPSSPKAATRRGAGCRKLPPPSWPPAASTSCRRSAAHGASPRSWPPYSWWRSPPQAWPGGSGKPRSLRSRSPVASARRAVHRARRPRLPPGRPAQCAGVPDQPHRRGTAQPVLRCRSPTAPQTRRPYPGRGIGGGQPGRAHPGHQQHTRTVQLWDVAPYSGDGRSVSVPAGTSRRHPPLCRRSASQTFNTATVPGSSGVRRSLGPCRRSAPALRGRGRCRRRSR